MLGIELEYLLAYITKTFRLRLTRFYKDKFHWTTNERWITHIYFKNSYELDLLRSVVRS